jgi:hypothetical protein
MFKRTITVINHDLFLTLGLGTFRSSLEPLGFSTINGTTIRPFRQVRAKIAS